MPSFAIFLVSVFCGAYAAVTQAYFAREFLVVFQGNEMSLAVLLSGWLVGVAGGARAARLRIFARVRAVFVMVLMLSTWVALFPLTITAIRLARRLFGVEPGSLAPLGTLLLASILLAAPFAAFVGFTFSTMCRVAKIVPGRMGAVGFVYVAEALGGVAGGVLFSFLLAGRTGPYAFGFGVYVLQCLVTLLLVWTHVPAGRLRQQTAVSITIGSLAIAAAGMGIWLGGRGHVLEENTGVARMMTIDSGVVSASAESRYQNLTAMRHEGQYSVYGNGEALFTFPEPALNEEEAAFVLTQHGDPERVLVIGGGPDFLAAVLAWEGVSVDYVELDSAIVEMSMQFVGGDAFEALHSDRVRLVTADARAFIRSEAKSGTRYDVVLCRQGDPKTLLLNRLFTREFFADVGDCLSDDGVFAGKVSLAGGYMGGEVGRYASGVYRTVSSVFADVLVTPGSPGIFVAAKRKGILSASVEELTLRFSGNGPQSYLFPALFASILPVERTRDVAETLRNLPVTGVNTDWRPTSYTDNLTLWSRFSGSRLAGWVLLAAGGPAWAVFAVLMIVLCLFPAVSLVKRTEYMYVSCSVAYTGGSAMGMTVMLIYTFQVKCGYVYDWIGVLVASFVGGLVVGGFVAGLTGRGKRKLLLAEAGAVLMPLVLFVVLGGVVSSMRPEVARFVILGLAAAAGAVTGFEFPVAGRLLVRRGEGPAGAGSRLESADHLGACAGALLTGIVLVPALGLWLSLLLLAAAKATTAAVVAAKTPRAGGR